MRIAGGRLKGRPRHAPAGRATRPTSDRVREAVFNVLAHGIEDLRLEDARVLDLFAGTGALGLEALSRGAARAVFVDDLAAARALIRENVAALGLGGQAQVWRRDARRLGACPGEPFDLVFLDPPYRSGLAAAALASARAGVWLAPGAVLVLELAADEAPPGANWLTLADRRRYGDTRILIFTAP